MSIINSEGRRSVGGSPHMCAEEAFAFRTDLTSHLVRLMSVNLKDDYYEGRLFNGLLNRGMPPEGSMLLTKRKKNLSLNSIGTLKAERGTLYYRPVTTCYMEH